MLISHVLSLSLLSFTHAAHDKTKAALVPIKKDDTCNEAMGKLMYDNLFHMYSEDWFKKTDGIAASTCKMVGGKDEAECKAHKKDCRWIAGGCEAVPCGQKVADGTAEVKETCAGHKETCVWRELSTEPKDNVGIRYPAACVSPDVKTYYDTAETNDAKLKCSELGTTAADCNGKKDGDSETTCYLEGTCKAVSMIGCDATTDPVLTAATCTTMSSGTCEFVAEKCKAKAAPKNACLEDADGKAPDETACGQLSPSCTWDTKCEETKNCMGKVTKDTCAKHTDGEARKCRFDSITEDCDSVEACEEKCWGDSLPGKWVGWDVESKFRCTTAGSVDLDCDATCVDGVATRGDIRKKKLAEYKTQCDDFKSHFDTAIAYTLTHSLEAAKPADFSAKLVKCKTHMKTAFDAAMKLEKDARNDKNGAKDAAAKEWIKFMVYSSTDKEIKEALAAIIGMSAEEIEKDVTKAVEKLNAKVEDDKTEAEVGGAVALSIARNSGALVLLAAWRHMAANF